MPKFNFSKVIKEAEEKLGMLTDEELADVNRIADLVRHNKIITIAEYDIYADRPEALVIINNAKKEWYRSDEYKKNLKYRTPARQAEHDKKYGKI